VERRIAPSVRIEDPIEQALLDGVSSPDKLSQLGRLGAQLILQRAAEDEVAAFLGRARYERTSEAAASRNGRRPAGSRPPRARSRSPCSGPRLPRAVRQLGHPDTRRIVRTRPLEALVIGAYVRAQTRLSNGHEREPHR
jgi:hypothetical protein